MPSTVWVYTREPPATKCGGNLNTLAINRGNHVYDEHQIALLLLSFPTRGWWKPFDKLCYPECNPPRPLASRHVDAPNQATNPPNLQNLKTSPQGGGFTLPLPPPWRSFSATCWHSWNPFRSLDTLKSFVKMSISCLWAHLGPIKVVMLTTLAQKIIILTILMPKKLHLDDFSIKKGFTGIYS